MEALEGNYPLFHDFYTARIKNMENVKPHEGHYALAELEEGLFKNIATRIFLDYMPWREIKMYMSYMGI